MLENFTPDQLKIGAFLLFAAGFTGFNAIQNLRRYQAIADTPTSKIRSASQGYVELSGTIEKADSADIQPLSGPLTGLPCVWYRYSIERYRRSGKSSHWQTVEDGVSEQAFLLDDATGECLVFPDGANVTTIHKKRWRGSSRRPMGGSHRGSSGFGIAISVMGIGFGQSYRYTEERLVTGDPMFALGHFETCYVDRSEMAKNKRTGEILREWKQNHDQLLARFDTNQDGEISPDEWQKARDEAARQADYELQPADDHDGLSMLSRCPGKRPFIISNKGAEDITKRYRNFCILHTVGFIASIAFLSFVLKT